jgi:signal transduction histidine kinase
MNDFTPTSAVPVRSARLETLVRAQLRTASSVAAERGTTVDMEILGEPRPIRADAARVCDAVAHVLQTAVRFSARGGKVSVWLEFGESSAALCVALDGDGATPEVCDGVLDERLGAARDVFEGYGGGLRMIGRELIASLEYGRA